MTLFTSIANLYTFAGVASKNGRRPVEADLSPVRDAVMLVSKTGTIVWQGSTEDWPKFAKTKSSQWRKSIKKVSLRNRDVLPAFSECHTHLLYAGSRAAEFERRNRGDSYLEIAKAGGGIRSTVEATAKASERELEVGILRRLTSLAKQGVVTVEIKTGYAGDIETEKRHLRLLEKIQRYCVKASRKLPRVVVTCLAAHSLPPGESEESWLAKVETLLPQLKRMRARLDIFIEKGAFSLEGAARLLERAKALGIAIVIHADQLSRGGGTALGARIGALSVDHVIEAGADEMGELAKTETVAVLLPAADLYTRLAYPKARQMIDAGVRVGLATDHNPGSSPGLDLALVGVLARTMMQMTLPEVLTAYTVNAAAALGQARNHGSLQAGFQADFIVLEDCASVADLFYEIGPDLSHKAVVQVWRDGVRLV